MKKIVCALLVLILMIFSGTAIAATAATESKQGITTNTPIYVNDQKTDADIIAISMNNSLYLPLRATSQLLGFNISWNQDDRAVHITTDSTEPQVYEKNGNAIDEGTIVSISESKTPIYIDGNAVQLLDGNKNEVYPVSFNNSLYLPLRALASSLGLEIEWNAGTKAVYIYTERTDKPTGEKGETGSQGPKGDKGDKGDPGTSGSQGTTGPQGFKGDKGDPGASGPQGGKGDKGDPGASGPQGSKGDKGDKGEPGVAGPQGSKGDKGEPGVAGPQGPAGPAGPAGSGNTMNFEGFSATVTGVPVISSLQFTNWNDTTPYYASLTFDSTNGRFIAPAPGKYAIHATINYKTTSPVSISIGSGIDPYFAVKKNGNFELLKGYMPILDVNIALVLTLRTVLGNGNVTLIGDVELQAGEVVELYYEADGLTLPLHTDIVWSIHRLS